MTFKKRENDGQAQNEDEQLVSVPDDLWSEDSSFYGDAEIKARLEAEVASFNPREFWDVHEWNFQCIIAQEKARAETGTQGVKRKRESDGNGNGENANLDVKKPKIESPKSSLSDASAMTASPSPAASKEPFNPYEDNDMAYQLFESLDDFFKRLRPSSTTIESGRWIWMANPYARRRHIYDDIGGFKQEGTRLLEEFMEKKQTVVDMNTGKPPGTVTRKLKPARDHLETEIVRVARAKNVTCGKWMLFPMPAEVNSVWRVVAKATLDGKLGCGAKVATDDGNSARSERLICVYTDDFSDQTDIERVVLEMKNLGLPVNGKDGRGIYYKCDAYTYLDIVSGNEYKLRASMYNSKELLGEVQVTGRRKS